jgi:hypothetical protein
LSLKFNKELILLSAPIFLRQTPPQKGFPLLSGLGDQFLEKIQRKKRRFEKKKRKLNAFVPLRD